MAGKRVFPPEWYAAQAARRKQRAEAKSSNSSLKTTTTKKESSKKKNTSVQVSHKGTVGSYPRKGHNPAEVYSSSGYGGSSSRVTVFKEKDGSNTVFVASGQGRMGQRGITKKHTNVSSEAIERHKKIHRRRSLKAQLDLQTRLAQDNLKEIKSGVNSRYSLSNFKEAQAARRAIKKKLRSGDY